MIRIFFFIFFCAAHFLSQSQSFLNTYPFDMEEVDPAHLSEALSYATISHSDTNEFDWDAFDDFIGFLNTTYPKLHEQLSYEKINRSLLFKWEGTKPDLDPILIYAHYDVVPVDQKTIHEWDYPPFEGIISDGIAYGRGALDDKSRVIAIAEAVELLLTHDYSPERSVFIAFGHDEEVNGWNGAHRIAAYLEDQGIVMESIFDEGGSVMEDIVTSLDGIMAFVSIAEKGSLNLEISLKGEGGHSSVPPSSTVIGEISDVIRELESNPMEARLTPQIRLMLEESSELLGWKERLAIQHWGLFKSRIRNRLAEDRVTDALIRTKYSINMINGGIKENILPQEVTARINVRVLQGDSLESVLAHFRNIISNPRVELTVKDRYIPPSPVSSINTLSYQILSETILESFPEATIIPTLLPGGTDSKHFSGLSDNIYRFSPVHLRGEEALSIHGSNERISMKNWEHMIGFYYRLIVKMTDEIDMISSED